MRNQLFQLLHMATAMALDLGLDKPARQELPANPAGLLPQLRLKYRLLAEEAEGRRAVLGCYYLSSTYAGTVGVINPHLTNLSRQVMLCITKTKLSAVQLLYWQLLSAACRHRSREV